MVFYKQLFVGKPINCGDCIVIFVSLYKGNQSIGLNRDRGMVSEINRGGFTCCKSTFEYWRVFDLGNILGNLIACPVQLVLSVIIGGECYGTLGITGCVGIISGEFVCYVAVIIRIDIYMKKVGSITE